MLKRPGGHQHSLIPSISRSSPAFEPTNEIAGIDGLMLVPAGIFAGAPLWHPSRPNIMKRADHRAPQHVVFMPGRPRAAFPSILSCVIRLP
jgi:hypothetical protein